MTNNLQYPIGEYHAKPFSQKLKAEWLLDIQTLPVLLEDSIVNLDEAQLFMPYREGGWSLIQVVHHLADSHMNAYIRFKLGFTENNPVIKPYNEKLWAELMDVRVLSINISITLLYALHARLHTFLLHFDDHDFAKTVYHPEHKKEMSLWDLMGMYAWHGKHHVAQITGLRERMKW